MVWPLTLPPRRLPATVLWGLPGAGKTTLLGRILGNRDGWRVAAIVDELAGLTPEPAKARGLLEVSEGCAGCVARGGPLAQVLRLARAGRFDYLLVEARGTREAAQAFGRIGADGLSVGQVSRLDTIVTVVDASTFMADFLDRGARTAELIGQVEFADVVVLNKLDRVTDERALEVEAVVKALNPKAKTFMSVRGQVPLECLLGTGLFDHQRAAAAAVWARARRPRHDWPQLSAAGLSVGG